MKRTRVHLILTVFLLVEILLVQWASYYPDWVETYYAKGMYPIISQLCRYTIGWIPFSVGDILIWILIFIVLKFLYTLIRSRGKHIGKRLLQAGAFLSVVYGLFYLLWGLNYYRQPLSKQLNFVQKQYSTEQLTLLCTSLIDSLNTLHAQLVEHDSLVIDFPYAPDDFYRLAPEGYKNLSVHYPIFQYATPSLKSSLMSTLQSYNGTSGYLNPLTGEAHVNCKIPKAMYPASVSHEMAHQLGYAAENEANFVGFLAASHHPDPYFKYSAYRMAFQYSLYELYKRNPSTYRSLYNTVNLGIRKELRASSDFWAAYKNPFEPIIKKGYNVYLKANNQTQGIDSYHYVVDLLISYYQL